MSEYIENQSRFRAVVIGCSAGGVQALSNLIPRLPEGFPLPVIIAQHMQKKGNHRNYLAENLNEKSPLHVKEAISGEKIAPGHVYISSPGYHLLIEDDFTFSLSVGPRVKYSIPSIDVLFESAAFAYSDQLIGIILTGANSDGADGLKAVKEYGGLTIVQDPKTAEAQAMPKAAINATKIDHLLPLEEIAELLISLEF